MNSIWFFEFSLAKDVKIPVLPNFTLFLLWKLRGIIISLDFCQIIFHIFEIIFRSSREFYMILWVFLSERCENLGSTKFFFLFSLKITRNNYKFRFLQNIPLYLRPCYEFETIFRLSREFYAILWVFLGERYEDPDSTKFFFVSSLKITRNNYKFRFLSNNFPYIRDNFSIISWILCDFMSFPWRKMWRPRFYQIFLSFFFENHKV